MRRCIKSYLVFTSLIYRIVIFAVMPAASIGIIFCINAFLIRLNLDIPPAWPVMVLTSAIIPMVEIIADHWVFGGIQAKRANISDYLKTSHKGMRTVKAALILDAARRLLSIAFIAASAYVAAASADMGRGMGAADAVLLIDTVFATHLFITLGLLLTRYGGMLWLNLITVYFIEILIALTMFVMGNINGTGFVMDGINGTGLVPGSARAIGIAAMAALDAAAVVLAVEVAMKRVEESYYER